MAEPGTRNASIALYQYLCRNIVGTDEHVKTIRMMNTVRDNFSHNKKLARITSGSFGEGLQMQGSDLDIMIIDKLFEVSEDAYLLFNPEKSYFAMETDDTQPGFTQLRLLSSNNCFIYKSCEVRGPHVYLSSTAFKQVISSNVLSIVHGPCMSDMHGFFDIARCLHGKSWIKPAMQWVTRSNNGWPGEDVKQAIIQHGALFVPIGIKGSINEDLEWRISFSVAEKCLIYTFTHTQLLCYALMKILLKDVIQENLECKDLLCSYFMKTILFWISEEFSPSIWRPENLLSNFTRCLRRLIYCVENSFCAHYFIPENNLFENKIQGKNQDILLNMLLFLNSKGWQCILLSHQFSFVLEHTCHSLTEPGSLYVESLQKLLCSITKLADVTIPTFSTMEDRLQILSSIKSSKVKHLHFYYMSKICNLSGQSLPFKKTSCNKFAYKQQTITIHNLLWTVRHDAVSGWLILASFFYKTKRYNLALAILQYSLSKCTVEKLRPYMKLSQIHYEVFELKIFRKMNIVQMWKFLLLDDVHFSENSTLMPDELQIKGKTTEYLIPPVMYAYFIRFLCHYHLDNKILRCDSVRYLKMSIENNCFISDYIDKALSYNLLGLALQLTGDKESAKQAFMQSIRLVPYPDLNSAYRRLSLMS